MNVHQICVHCGSDLLATVDYVSCQRCSARWPVTDGVARFDSAKYFGEVTQERMKELIALSQEGNWLDAARQMFKDSDFEMYQYITDLNRASWIPLLPISPESTVLDVGCGLGALTHSLALNYERVVSIEPIPERVQYAKIRCDQEGLKNVDVIQASLNVLPFAEKTFDLIVLNGILEWVGEWQRDMNPRDAQLHILRKLRKLLTPTGMVFIGIENRIGIDSFFGRTDHPGTRFTSLMPRWLASLYIKLKRPDFYRTLIHSWSGYRTYTYSPRGYRKLLGEAGFASVECWWPPAGYNLPYMILNSRNRQGVKDYCAHEQKYSDRVHGYSWKRLLKRRAVVDTNLIFHLFPDVLLLARPKTELSNDEGTAKVSLTTSILRSLSGGSNGDYVGSLVSHPYKNKSVLTIVSAQGAVKAIAKVSNDALPGADLAQIEYQRQRLIYSSLQRDGLTGSIPKPLGIIRVGRTIGTLEEVASGTRMVELTVDANYFKNKERIQRHLDIITRWLIDATRALETVETDGVLEKIPQAWYAEENVLKELSHRKLIQHGDFFPENIFLNEDKGTVSVIDWDHCGCGYPPLFDWFCLITGFYYTHQKIARLPKSKTIDFLSFQQTYFEPSWFADLILASSKHLCQSLGFDAKHINTYFKAYLVLRRHQFISRVDLGESNYWAPLYQQYLEYYLHHESQTIFHEV